MKKQLVLASILMMCSLAGASAHEEKDSCTTGQDLAPIKQVGMYLDGYHTYKSEEKLSADKQQQIRTAHYCMQINPDLFQCLIYDGNTDKAKCIGVEYVITDKGFQTLSAEEQKNWHPHDAEVDTGLLILPGLPEAKQKEILAVLRSTHGKTWQVWPNLADQFPLGSPALMWSVDPNKISEATKKSAATRATSPSF